MGTKTKTWPHFLYNRFGASFGSVFYHSSNSYNTILGFFFFFSFFSKDFSSPIAGALQDYTAASFSKLLLCIAVEFEESIGNLF